MATFTIVHQEGVHMVEAKLENEMIRAERGALNHLVGDITIDAPLPGLGALFTSLLAEESIIRPKYTGTGTVYFQSSLGGFHVLEVADDPWIIEPGAYFASEGSVALTVHREKFLTSLWAGEGFFYYQTQVKGRGKVVIAAQGKVEEVALENGRVVDEQRAVLARTKGVNFRIGRATRRFIDKYWSGEKAVRVYQGTGKLLICHTPYWRYRVAKDKQGQGAPA